MRGPPLLLKVMRYLFTQNATQGYRGKKHATYFHFKAVQTLSGWVGVFEANDSLADDLIESNPQISEVDEKFYNEIIKKKNATQNPNSRQVQVTLDSTKPIHAHEKQKDVESAVVVDEIELIEVESKEVKEEKPKAKKDKKK